MNFALRIASATWAFQGAICCLRVRCVHRRTHIKVASITVYVLVRMSKRDQRLQTSVGSLIMVMQQMLFRYKILSAP